MILIDSSALINYLKGRRTKGAAFLQESLDRGVPWGITEAVYHEVLQGAANEEEWAALETYLSGQRFFSPGPGLGTYRRAARIYFDARVAGHRVRSTLDCLIAAVAIELDLVLCNDDADFTRLAKVCELRVA